jgi:phosphomannomutase
VIQVHLVNAWLSDDPDRETRDVLQQLLASAAQGDAVAIAELEDAFSGDLEFGTAGLRGRLGPGPNRMNRAVVSRAAAGLAAFLGHGTIVIGYDARHKSDVFARDTAQIMEAAGIHALVFPRPLPTPLLAFAVRHLGCRAGVMVTASHNPARDNGYKVYLGDGTQIVPPTDAEISAAIRAVGPVLQIPRATGWETLDDAVLAAYIAACVRLVPAASPRKIVVAYTAMHGVGGTTMLDLIEGAGFPAPVVVPTQFDPDPDFPTVEFPNPEEPGAIDLAVAQGVAAQADLVIANDPDADRCAAAIPTPDGSFRMLRGDEVGALLGWWLVERARRRGEQLDGIYANSIVSGSLLAKMAASYGLRHEETLTGFKWIGRIPGLIFGYEEALGYCVDPANVRDKDGLSAALLLVQLVADLKSQGRTVGDVLDDLACDFGLHATAQLAVRVQDLSLIATVMATLRQNPPSTLAGMAVTDFQDLMDGVGGLPPTDGLRILLSDGGRVIVRPSGTEPKIKCYLEIIVPVAGDLTAARRVADERLAALSAAIAVAAGLDHA